ncbi:uncharacterized protein [Scyliorhinus torazame]|uniref:uncharacterized protein n=1 Tax=Scyliorhinus torazame TaxID=75743 RepID=UPI003B5C2F1A
MGVWAPAESPSSRLRLANALLRVAVQHRYLRDSSQEQQVHLFLAVHLWRLTDPEENRRFTDCDPETLGDLPQHLAHTNQISAVAFFSEDGFAVGSFDKRVSIWTLRPHQHSVRMHLQSTFSLDFPTYYMSMLRMQDRLLVGDLKGNLVAWSPEEGRRTLMESDYLCYLFSRVIERRDGSLLAVDGPRCTSLLVLEKKIKSSSSEQERSWEDCDSEAERETEKQDGEPIPDAEQNQESEKRDTDPEQDVESEKRDTDPEQDVESEKRDTDPEQDVESEKRDTDPEQDVESEKRDTDPEQDVESEKLDTDPEQDAELLQVSNMFQVTPWGLYSPETSDTFLWLTVVKESGTMPGGAHSILCADSRGSLWRSVWDPTVAPTDETSEQRNEELMTWTHKQVHSDRVTAVSDTKDLIVTASYDRTVRLWNRASLKQVGLFPCQAPVLCLEVNPVIPGMGVCGDSSGNIYFLNWDSFPSDDETSGALGTNGHH